MGDFKDKFIAWVVQRLMAGAISKTVGTIATAAVVHGFLKTSESSDWVSSTTEMALGAAAYAITWAFTYFKHKWSKEATTSAVQIALVTPAPAIRDVAQTAKDIIERPTPNGLQ